MKYSVIIVGLLGLLLTKTSYAQQLRSDANSFLADYRLLKQKFTPLVLKRDNQALLVIPELQGRIMSVTLDSLDDQSIGWFNRDYLQQEHTERNAVIGGAQRLMFGPETGQYSMFFQPNTRQTAEHIYSQDAITFQPYPVKTVSENAVKMQTQIKLINYSGHEFKLNLQREISLFSKTEIQSQLNMTIPRNVKFMGYGSKDSLQNKTYRTLQKSTGLVSLWTLTAYRSNPTTTALIPFKGSLKKATPYFNNVRASHTQIEDSYLLYRADGEYMNKIGIPVKNTKPIMAAYDASRNLLTIQTFYISNKPNANYLTASWLQPKTDYEGEIVNIFNDGPDDEGNYFGHFYEMEASSAAFELAPNEIQSHFHNIYHFQGNKNQLNTITSKLLGVSLSDIKMPAQ